MSENHVSNFIGVFLGIVNLLFVKFSSPKSVSFRKSVKRIVANPEGVRRFDAEDYALAVLKRNKEVFDRLADM